MHRFYLPPTDFIQDRPRLSAEETHHACQVLRLPEGGKVVVFDGAGNEARARLGEIVNHRAELFLEQRVATPPLPCQLTLIQAVPKGKNMDLIVQKAVELGARRIIPLLSERTVVQIEGDEARRKQEKWQAVVLEACKQCGQNFLPTVALPVTPKEYFQRPEPHEWNLIASLQPDSHHIKASLALAAETLGHAPRTLSVMVGPEGDFTPAESALARSHGFHPITLGPIILRTETAALYCLSVLAHELF
jgi:16S rRNA (uracil1498-N3)-methyltransferase